jgi:hypothetical protein
MKHNSPVFLRKNVSCCCTVTDVFTINLISFVTGEVGALLPVVATLLQFSPDEVNWATSQ